MSTQEVFIGKNRVSIAGLIGKGGEGEVYAIAENSKLAIKIYKAGLRIEREEKVRAMVAGRLAIKTDLVAYPKDVVTDHRGNFLGFVMPLLLGYRPLHELYSPKSRKQHFPKADYRFIVHAALNVARAVGKVHDSGCIIGDINHSGVLVAPDATVALIDADSFQFHLSGKSFPCVVGVPDFTPPELHGINLASVDRTIVHDNFGLAVAIFHLLFMGRHPYSGLHNGQDISMGEAIAQNRFAYSLIRRDATQTTPPPGALRLDIFPDAIARAFENSFGVTPNARPNAIEWINALASLERSLNHCNKFSAHYYPRNAGHCVWCKLAANSGFDMFPSFAAVIPNIPSDARGTEQAISEILAFHFPTVTNLLPTVASPGKASVALQQEINSSRRQALLGSLMIGVAVFGLINASSALLLWIGLAFIGWVIFSSRKVADSAFHKAFKDADERVQRELNAFVQRNGMVEVLKVRSDLDTSIQSYRRHEDSLARALALAHSSRESRQRQAYLDRFSIRQANISGIGPAKTATLISFGIETAADVNRRDVSAIPGFGAVMTSKILAWRHSHEARFRYDPLPNAQDVADERALREDFAAEKAKLESTIRNGLGTLRNAKSRLDALPALARSDKALSEALLARAQAEQDLRELGVPVPISTVVLASTTPVSLASSTIAAPSITTYTSSRASMKVSPTTCPYCSFPMALRSGRYGQFWGCTRYPVCNGTRNI